MSDCRNPYLSAYDRAAIEDAERSTKAAQTAQGCVDDEIVYGFQFCDKPDSTMLGETVFDSVGEPIGWIVANGPKGDCGWGSTFCPQCGGDLLTDDETCPNSNGTCPDADGTASVAQDSRERLEAEIRYEYNGRIEWEADQIIGWLDRQDAITERKCREYEDALREQHHKRIAELKADNDCLRDRNEQLDYEVRDWKREAETQRNNFYQATEARKHWQREYESVMAERDRYREKLGRALDAAHEIASMVDES